MAGPATLIGVYARVSGVWQRINGGTPEGFSGPQTRSGSIWRNSVWVHAYASGWQVCWANVNGEVSMPTTVISGDFEFGAPWAVDTWVEYNADGSIDRKHNQTIQRDYSSWRDYDNGRDYQVHVLRDVNFDATITTVEPTLGTWQDFTTTRTFRAADSGSGFLNKDTGWAVYTREKVRADPLGSVPRGDVDLTLEAEF